MSDERIESEESDVEAHGDPMAAARGEALEQADVEAHGDQSNAMLVCSGKGQVTGPTDTRRKGGSNAGLIAVARLAKPFPVSRSSPPGRASEAGGPFGAG